MNDVFIIGAGQTPVAEHWDLGLRELPGFWAPFDSGLFSLLMVMVVPAILAAALGLLMFKGRVIGVYFSIITQALALIATLIFVGQQPYTGGTNQQWTIRLM